MYKNRVLDIVQNKEFWRKGTVLVELCGPIMNVLRMAERDIPGTGKVYHENFKFKLGKILDGQIFTNCYMLLDTALIRSFILMTTLRVQRRWQTYLLCATKFMEQAVLNLPRHS